GKKQSALLAPQLVNHRLGNARGFRKMLAVIAAEPTRDFGECKLRPGPQSVESRVDNQKLRLRTYPVVVVAVIPKLEHQPDVAGVTLTRKPLSRPGVRDIATGIGVEEAEIGRHRRERVIPR